MKKLLFTACLVISMLLAISALWYFFTYEPGPEMFTKDRAAIGGLEHLKEYAAEHQVPLHEFKGPYLEESLGLEFPTYIVCYSHPRHHFCFLHWQGDVVARPLRAGEPPEKYGPPEYELYKPLKKS